jgi:trimethylamine---corrinoid protein Co-methyltransferase
MKTGHDLYYRAEKMKFKIIGNQMGKFYHLPIAGEAGGTMTWRADVQNGMEGISYLLASIACGQNIICGVGSMHNANGMSAEQIIMQCGMIDMAEYLAAGVDTSDYKLATNSIRQTGPGGNYLCDNLSLELLRSSEFFESPYLDLSGGYHGPTPSMAQIAHQKANEIVESYKTAVPEKVQHAIRNYFKDKYTRKESVNQGW